MLSEQGSPGPRGDSPDLETIRNRPSLLEEQGSLYDGHPLEKDLAKATAGALDAGGMFAVLGLCPPAAVYMATRTAIEGIKKTYHHLRPEHRLN